MAKAREIPGLSPDLAFATAAARTVAVRAAELFEHLEGVLDVTDIERVHDARVATRRLRAVLELYAPCFPQESFAAALSDVKRLADALGARRDPDVHLESLAAFADAATPADRPGLQLLLDRIGEEQDEGNMTLAQALVDVREHALRERLAMLVEAAGGVEGP